MHVPRAGQPGPACRRTHLCVVRPAGPVHAWTTYTYVDGSRAVIRCRRRVHGMAMAMAGRVPDETDRHRPRFTVCVVEIDELIDKCTNNTCTCTPSSREVSGLQYCVIYVSSRSRESEVVGARSENEASCSQLYLDHAGRSIDAGHQILGHVRIGIDRISACIVDAGHIKASTS